MKELEKLIHIVTKFGPKKLPLLNQEGKESNTLENQLYNNIKAGKYKDDGEAMADLYGRKEDYFKYRMLKSRLRQKLFNHLYFIKNKSLIPRQTEKECLNMVFQGKTLMHIADYDLAANLFKKALKISIDYDFTDLIIDCLENLNFIYTHQPNYDGFFETLNKLKKYRCLRLAENEAYDIYYIARVELKRSVVLKKRYIRKLPAIILQLKKLWKETNSFNIFNYYYFLNHWHLELTGNFIGIIKNIELCEKLLTSGKINSLRFDKRLNNYYHVYALLRAQQYKKGLKLAAQYLKNFSPYSRNWFAFMEFYFLLAMHTENYGLADELIAKVDSNPYYHRLKVKAKEDWNLYRAYLSFIYPKDHLRKSFNFQEFVATVPENSKDKMGHNISILILQFLYLIKEKDFEQLSNKEDSFRKYASTYLKDPHTIRSYYFFKMLVVTIRTDFDREKCIIKAAPLLEKLRTSPVPGDAYAEIEIIPYEKLWEIVLEHMEEKRTSPLSYSLLK